MSKLLVLDFDGTITDAEVEGAPFRGGYLGDVALLAGISKEEVERLAVKFEAEIAADPDKYGWVFNGAIVAPASVDPYLRIMPIARKIFDATGTFMDEADRTRLLDSVLYKYNYKKTVMAFRSGAGEALRGLSGTNTWVVTNSHTEPVQDKIRTLDGGVGDLQWLVERVHGRASKYILDDSFDRLPASMVLPDLERPVFLRRKHYYGVLNELREACGADWSEATVVGDIFELDLALPWHLGAKVGLMVNPFTPKYEKDFLREDTRGGLLSSLSELREFAGV